MKTKTITSADTDESDSRAYAPAPASRLASPIPATREHNRVRRGLERGDLLAIPLCILWGVGLWLSSYGPAGIFWGGEGSGTDLSFLWSWPATVMRYIFGW